MNNKPLVIHSAKPLSPKEGNTIRAVLSDESYSELKQIAEETGIYISQLSRLCIEYALSNIKIEE